MSLSKFSKVLLNIIQKHAENDNIFNTAVLPKYICIINRNCSPVIFNYQKRVIKKFIKILNILNFKLKIELIKL